MASNVLHGTDDEKIKELCTKTHKEQAIWYLNAFWEEGAEADKELFWLWVDKFNQVDLVNGASGNALDELNAHRFLEHFKETQTVMEMRTNLREVGAIPKTGRPKDFPITHFLIARFKKDWHRLVNASQGDNKEAIEEAQRKLDAALDAMQAADDRAKEAAAALREALSRESAAKASEAAAKQQEADAHASAEAAKSREADAHASAEASKAREVDLKAAQAELEAALAEVKKQEDAYNAKTAELKAKSEGAGVSAMRAKNELAQHLGEDPLPLRRAKITAEAAVKKSERATKAAAEARTKAEADAQEASKARTQADADAAAASEARAQAEADARAAEAARTAAEEAKGVADAAAEEARCKVAEAEAFLQEEKSKPGQAFGALWWMERALYERKKYMPVAKGGVRE